MYAGMFGVVNHMICLLLNGTKSSFESQPKFAAKRKELEHEQWVFMNGVAVGQHWLQSNIDRLAITFSRPIIGIHNKTLGIPFDLLQVLFQRVISIQNPSLRANYTILKHYLYKPSLSKVILIMHSQGGIEGSLVLDWLLAEVPQDLLTKLEIYTFGNAANHFNNPHLHMRSQEDAFRFRASKTYLPRDGIPGVERDGRVGKTIHHIEHYTNTCDFVAKWGVLHFINPSNSLLNDSPDVPRFMGRVFEEEGRGHQFVMHYLDSMFPLKAAEAEDEGIGESGFEGANEENDFMDEIVDFGSPSAGDENSGFAGHILESMRLSAVMTGARNPNLSWDRGEVSDEVGVLDESPIALVRESWHRSGSGEFGNGFGFTCLKNGGSKKVEYRVRDLSRLWRYRNGRSPENDSGPERRGTI